MKSRFKPSIKVRFYPPLKETLGEAEVSFEASDAHEALSMLAARYGKKFSSEVLNEDGSVRNYYIIICDGKIVNQKNPRAFALKPGDVLEILPPVAGG